MSGIHVKLHIYLLPTGVFLKGVWHSGARRIDANIQAFKKH